ncbi:hypothetical protein B0H14DRAFT_2562105 [Mycena olivaceomarginata]|nr:hypothetical protein B0H14DRAFT_2562105 [Mycena olivaceomarginata]
MPKDWPTMKKKNLVRIPVAISNRCGGTKTSVQPLNPGQRRQLQDATNQKVIAHIAALSQDKGAVFNKLRDRPDNTADNSEDEEDGNTYNYNDIVEGNIGIGVSHAGGEMAALQEKLAEEKKSKCLSPTFVPHNYRTQCHVLGMHGQMSAMTDIYVKWGATQGEYGLEGSPPEAPEMKGVEKTYPVKVIDVFSETLVPDKNGVRLINFRYLHAAWERSDISSAD